MMNKNRLTTYSQISTIFLLISQGISLDITKFEVPLNSNSSNNTNQTKPLCAILTQNNTCSYCFGGSPTQQVTPKCVPFQEGSHCLAARDDPSQHCYWCKPGYYRTTNGRCRPQTQIIENCYLAFESGDQILCDACREGFPSSDSTRCIPFSQLQTPLQNCITGTRSPMYRAVCLTCEPGYAADYQSRAYPCNKLAGRPGCWAATGNLCYSCRAMMGYQAVGVNNGTGQVCELVVEGVGSLLEMDD